MGLLLEGRQKYGGRVTYLVHGNGPGDIPGVWKWTNAMLWNMNAGVGRGWGGNCMAICSECMGERASEIWGCIIYYTYTVYASYRRLWMYIEWGAFAIGAGWSTNHLPALFQISILYRAGRSYK